MQGGIHPEYTGQTYLSILQAVKDARPASEVLRAGRRSPRSRVSSVTM